MALNDTRLRNLKPKPGKTERLVADGNGLYIRIRVGEGKITRTWQFRRREGGDLTITTLGTYPALPILEARQQALDLASKRTSYSPTVEQAAEQWLAERIDTTHRKPEPVRGFVDRGIIPALRSWRLRDIEPSELAGVIRGYRDRAAKTAKAREGGRAAGRVLLSVAKNLFGYCVANGWIRHSPAAQLTGALVGAPLVARTRVLTDDEIKFVVTLDGPVGAVLRFVLATGCRISEAYNGYRDGQYWVVPAGVAKNKVEHRVWLSALALAQLEQAHPWTARRSFVQHWVTANAGGWSAHDIRRSFSTRLNDMGVPPHIVELLLNHALRGVAGTYNKATYDAERRRALEAWSTRLKALVETEPADVVSLRQVSQHAA